MSSIQQVAVQERQSLCLVACNWGAPSGYIVYLASMFLYKFYQVSLEHVQEFHACARHFSWKSKLSCKQKFGVAFFFNEWILINRKEKSMEGFCSEKNCNRFLLPLQNKFVGPTPKTLLKLRQNSSMNKVGLEVINPFNVLSKISSNRKHKHYGMPLSSAILDHDLRYRFLTKIHTVLIESVFRVHARFNQILNVSLLCDIIIHFHIFW